MTFFIIHIYHSFPRILYIKLLHNWINGYWSNQRNSKTGWRMKVYINHKFQSELVFLFSLTEASPSAFLCIDLSEILNWILSNAIGLLYYFSPFIGIRNLWCAQVLLDWNQIYDFDNFEKINTYYNLFYYIYSYINYCQKSIENEIIVLHWK